VTTGGPALSGTGGIGAIYGGDGIDVTGGSSVYGGVGVTATGGTAGIQGSGGNGINAIGGMAITIRRATKAALVFRRREEIPSRAASNAPLALAAFSSAGGASAKSRWGVGTES
jgi:hypothetical protein